MSSFLVNLALALNIVYQVNACCDYYEANDAGLLVIPAECGTAASNTSKWTTRSAISGFEGQSYVEWDSGNSDMGITQPTAENALSFGFKTTNAGHYRFVMRCNSPGKTDHNDIFVNFTAVDIYGYKQSDGTTRDVDQPAKAYHNKGDNEWSYTANTVDSNAHIIITENLSANTQYTVSILGRSTMMKVDTIILFNCDGGESCKDKNDLFKAAKVGNTSMCVNRQQNPESTDQSNDNLANSLSFTITTLVLSY
eukprot:Awhi_evm1s2430